jgi:CheY-like chemotaxis protein
MSGKNILVVEDDLGTRTVIKTILSAHGHTVVECKNGREATKAVTQQKFDLIVLDIMMPEMSGYDVVIFLKQRPETQRIPIIMVTAKAEAEDMILGYRDYGVEYYITKPFTTSQLIQGVTLILNAAEEEKPKKQPSSLKQQPSSY